VIRVVVADDQALVRGALAMVLDLESDIEVVGEASTGDELLAVAAREEPDIALVDVHMPDTDGLAAAVRMRTEVPGCRVVICTTFGRPGYLLRAMEAGAFGFIVKNSTPENLVAAVRKVASGLRVVDPALAAESMTTGHNPLTEREREVLGCAADGATVERIARRLHLSNGTVRNHLSAAIGKTGASTRAEACKIAEERGWL
jgi:two-component system, NarL family, response regulator DesR